MSDVKSKIKERFIELEEPEEFAQAINDLGLELMDSGDIDSDEVVWEVAREIWKDFAPDFEEEVSEHFDDIVEEN